VVFRHKTIEANILSDYSLIHNTTFANTASDLLVVTPFCDNVYVNAPIGVFFTGTSWAIFRQDDQPMPVGAMFSVLVLKQWLYSALMQLFF
jgi:hypothetical protein